MNAGKQIDPADDYEAAAECVAKRYGGPIDAQLVRALIDVPAHVLEAIEADPQDWNRRVHEYAHGLRANA
jgi:hypothetical protein